eukprot:COSAG06_NODE_9133_length_1978_cov_2.754657_2_plen_61_part_00
MSQGNGIRTRATRSKTRYLGVGNDVLPDSKKIGAAQRPPLDLTPAKQTDSEILHIRTPLL